MGKLAKPEKQAASVIKFMQKNGHIRSLGTARCYTEALTRVAEYSKTERIHGGLRGISIHQAKTYLVIRAEEVGQKQLDMERQALQAMLQHVTNYLSLDDRLPVTKSEHAQILKCRSYTSAQVQAVSNAQQTHNSLATRLAYASGLRGHELLTLRRCDERSPSSRPTCSHKFYGLSGEKYTVQGKGGLIREVIIPHSLAIELESRRLPFPQKITDRGIHYAQHYDIGAGQRWSNSFSQASKRILGWSTGAHGLRHSYAQNRMQTLQSSGLNRGLALLAVSQEMGHFRPEITEVYLR